MPLNQDKFKQQAVELWETTEKSQAEVERERRQYTSDDFRQLLADHHVTASMSRKGNCLDNAVAESFFATLKTELVDVASYATRQQAETDIFFYIEGFYNRTRLHSHLDYCSPVEFEENYARQQTQYMSISCVH